MFHMKMRLEKPEIAKRAGEEGKIYSFGKEIWRFILVFLIGSFIAGLLLRYMKCTCSCRMWKCSTNCSGCF